MTDIMDLNSAIELSLKAGPNAHYFVALVVKHMFGDMWVYKEPMGWRVNTGTMLLFEREAIYYIKRKLSEDVADAYSEYGNEKAIEVAEHLRNNSYKNEIVEEAASLFSEF